MEEQKTFQDELEAKVGQFIHKVAKRYKLQILAQGEIEFRSRSVGLPYEHNTDKFTDDKIYELIIRIILSLWFILVEMWQIIQKQTTLSLNL